MKMDAKELGLMRRAMLHSRLFRPTVPVEKGSSLPSAFVREPLQLEQLVFTDQTGRSLTIGEALQHYHTDAFLVLHKGRIVFEQYYGEMEPLTQHGLASVTKSIVGILVAMELHNGTLSGSDRVDSYIPELTASAFGDASIDQLLDMQISCAYPVYFPEANYIDNQRNVLLTAMGTLPAKEGYNGPRTIHEYLASITKAQEHGAAFSYSNGPAEVLGWILHRVTGKPLAQLLSERIWSKLGAEKDAYFIVDTEGTAQACGGLHAALRDIARFAEMLRKDGVAANGQQVVPKAVIDDIRSGGDRNLFAASSRGEQRPGFSYRKQWWITHNDQGAYEANGLYGQRIHIAPQAELVIVQLSTHPGHSDETASVFARAFEAIANHLN